jgi:hypothetical protein
MIVTSFTAFAASWRRSPRIKPIINDLTVQMGGADERTSARRSDPIFASPVRRHHAHYEIDSVLPPSQQMVELTAAVASDVEWFV